MYEMNDSTMQTVVTLKYYLYGYVNAAIIILGFAGNMVAIYILNTYKDMRKPSINIFLTVLAIYDNGVLIFSILMLNVPAITDYRQMTIREAAAQHNTHPPPSPPSSPSSSAEMPPLNINTVITTPATTANINQQFHQIYMQQMLNKTLEMFLVNCFKQRPHPPPGQEANNRTTRIHSNKHDHRWFDNAYCGMLRRLGQYEAYIQPEDEEMEMEHEDVPDVLMPIHRTIECDASLNETLYFLDKMDDDDNVDPVAVVAPSQYLLMFRSGIGPGRETTDPYRILCQTLCLMTGGDSSTQGSKSSARGGGGNSNISPLIYYVKVVYPLALISQTGSIWTTCLITVERYLAICHPLMTMTLSTRTRAIYSLSIVSLLAILFNLPRFAEVDTTCQMVKATNFRRNKIYYQVYYIFLNLSLNYILPLSLLSALNIKIYASVRRASANRNELTRARQSELHLASMLVAIVAIFIACNAPAFIVNCMEPYFEVGTPVLETLTIFSNVLVCFNSSINFVIYCIFGRKFRMKFIRLLRLDRIRCVARCLDAANDHNDQNCGGHRPPTTLNNSTHYNFVICKRTKSGERRDRRFLTEYRGDHQSGMATTEMVEAASEVDDWASMAAASDEPSVIGMALHHDDQNHYHHHHNNSNHDGIIVYDVGSDKEQPPSPLPWHNNWQPKKPSTRIIRPEEDNHHSSPPLAPVSGEMEAFLRPINGTGTTTTTSTAPSRRSSGGSQWHQNHLTTTTNTYV